MKSINLLYIICFAFIIVSCGDNENEDTIYKQNMREFVIGISEYGKSISPGFIIIPQNGQELVTQDGNEDDPPEMDYLNAIDGVGREDLYYGYRRDNKATPDDETGYMTAFLDVCEENGVEVLTTDYCSDHEKMDDSYKKNENKGYISYAAPDRELNQIPAYPSKPYNENSNDINSLSDAKNFLYLLNPEKFASKKDMINAMKATNYDVIIMDLFFEDEELTQLDIEQLQLKANTGKRLIIAYMSIGEAEDYRFYWDDSWKVGSPSWIKEENPDWEGNYKVKYWDSEWQDIIYGNDRSYLDKILSASFDGVYLDIIDAFEYFE